MPIRFPYTVQTPKGPVTFRQVGEPIVEQPVQPEREPDPPARVNGNERQAVAVFVNDSRGDLVDIRYYCRFFCADARPECDGALWWPAFDFGDADACCQECGALINKGRKA